MSNVNYECELDIGHAEEHRNAEGGFVTLTLTLTLSLTLTLTLTLTRS